MGKNQSASNLTNVIQYSNGNITFVSGSTTLMSISSSGAITTTGVISGSNALSASYASNADTLDGLDSTVFTLTSSFNAFSSSILAQTASLNSFSASVLSYTSSANNRFSSIETVTGSNITRLGALEAATGSLYNYTSSLNLKTASFATTGSNTFIGTQTISGSVLQSGSFTTTGTIIAQTINVQTVTSSIVYSSGSNIFGNLLNNTQTFTGSVLITGSLTIAGASSATSYSGATLYGSTTVCSPVGKFTSCIDAGTGTFSSTIGTAGDITITKASAASFIANNTSVSGKSYRLVSTDSGTFIIQNTGIADLVTITSTGISTFASTICAPTITISGNVNGGSATFNGIAINQTPSSVGTSANFIRFTNTGNDLYVGQEGSTGGGFFTGACAYDNVLYGGRPLNIIMGGSSKIVVATNGITNFTCQICAPIAIFTGCVGIGITSPTTKLDVYAGVCTSAIIWGQTIRNEGNAATTGYGIGLKFKISGDSVPNELYKWAGITGVAGTDYSNRTDLAFYTNAASVAHATEKVRITGDGNVGIGTCAPNAKLTVWTSSTTGLQTALRLNNPFGFANQNTGAQIIFSQDRSVAEDLQQGIIAVGQQDAGTSATSFMAFYTNNTGLGERLRISSEGVACFSRTICTPIAMIGSSCSPSAGINYLGQEGYRQKWLITQGRYRFCFGTEDFYGAIFIEMYGTNYNQGTSEVRVGKAVIPLRYATSRSIVQVYDAGGVCVGAYRTNGIGLVWCNINGTVGDLIYTNAGSQQPDSVLATELQLLSAGFSLIGKFYRMCHTNTLYDATNPYV